MSADIFFIHLVSTRLSNRMTFSMSIIGYFLYWLLALSFCYMHALDSISLVKNERGKKRAKKGGGRDCLVVKNTCYSTRELRFNHWHPHGGSQLVCNTSSGEPVPFSGFWGPQANMYVMPRHKYGPNTHAQKIFKNKQANIFKSTRIFFLVYLLILT